MPVISLLLYVFMYTETVAVITSPTSIINYTNGSAEFLCQASGIPVPSITWFKDNLPLTSGNRVTIDTTNTSTPNERNTTSVLTISDLQLSDTADYHCVASNPGATGTGVTFTDTSVSASLLVQCKCTRECKLV